MSFERTASGVPNETPEGQPQASTRPLLAFTFAFAGSRPTRNILARPHRRFTRTHALRSRYDAPALACEPGALLPSHDPKPLLFAEAGRGGCGGCGNGALMPAAFLACADARRSGSARSSELCVRTSAHTAWQSWVRTSCVIAVTRSSSTKGGQCAFLLLR